VERRAAVASAVVTSTEDAPARARGPLVAWAAWDCGSASFNAVITTFVFTVYLTGSVAADETSGSSALGLAIAISGVAVALVAPVWGQRGDAAGGERGRQRRLGVLTGATVLATALMALVAPEPSFLLLGLVLLGVGTFTFELASVEYNALIPRVAPPGRAGRVSAIGWAAGYVGGLVLLTACAILFLISLSSTTIRVITVISAVWFGLFAIPVLLTRFPFGPPSGDADAARAGIFGSYKLLVHRLVALRRTDPHLLGFLVSSAIFRDGLTGIFTLGGVLATGTFGLSTSDVLIFAIAANLVSAVGAVVGGIFDDRIGPKPVIVASLTALVLVALSMLLASGSLAFWIGGLALSLFVGPAQACSRSYLTRLVPPGREGELFGLYATTGRAVSFLAPALFSLFIFLFDDQQWGIAGIGLVLLLGLVSLLPVRGVPGRLGAGDAAIGAEPAPPEAADEARRTDA